MILLLENKYHLKGVIVYKGKVYKPPFSETIGFKSFETAEQNVFRRLH